MGRSGGRSVLFLVGLVVIALGSVSSPASADWVKLFDCTNTTGNTQYGIKVQLKALEYIPFPQYSDPQYPNKPVHGPLWWSPGQVGGTVATNITYPGSGLPPPTTPPNTPPIEIQDDGTVRIGWNTKDNYCRLSNIRWLRSNGDPGPIFQPTQISGVPGGGVAFYSRPEPGDPGHLTLAITNDNVCPDDDWTGPRPDPSQLALGFDDVTYAISRVPVHGRKLHTLLRDGFRGEESVDAAHMPPNLPPSATQAPPMLRAHPLTDLPGPTLDQWDPEDPSRTQMLEGSVYVPWSSIVGGGQLLPGQYTVLVIPVAAAGSPPEAEPGEPTIREGGALIIRGTLQDAEGNEFRWLEQIVATDPPPVSRVRAETRGTDVVTVRLTAQVSGTSPGGFPWSEWRVGCVDPAPVAMTDHSVTLAAGAKYTVKLRAEDGHGNLSAQTDIVIAVPRS